MKGFNIQVIPHQHHDQHLIIYYQELLDFLCDMFPYLEDLIEQFDETWENKE